jgi:TetR/AcrR family transcriptional regulator, mexCD-oprJ operon repressor
MPAMQKRKSAITGRTATGIVESAAVLLAEQGAAASMEEIAKGVGVSRATLYRYFPTRDALLQRLAEAAFADLRNRIEEAELDTMEVRSAIGRLARISIAAGSRYITVMDPTFREPISTEDFDTHIARPVLALLRRGIADGTLRGDLPPEVLFEIFGGLIEKCLSMVMQKQLGVDQAGDALASIFLDGTVQHRSRSG